MNKKKAVCALCYADIRGPYTVCEGLTLCRDCVRDYSCWADPAAFCSHCGALISDEKFLAVPYGGKELLLCAQCLNEAEKGG